MDKNYYNEYYTAERKHWFFRARNKILMDHVAKLVKDHDLEKPINILNVGVATGFTSELLAEQGNITSVEYDEDCYAFTKENSPNINLVQGSILDLDFEDNSFDLVCAFDVIEHIEDDKTGVSEMQRVCKPGGLVMVTVPAFMSMWGPHDIINHHFRRYRKKQLTDLFESPKKLVYSGYFNFFLFPMIWIVRKITNFRFKKNGSDTSTVKSDLSYSGKEGLASSILYHTLGSESKLINSGISLPFGVSILASWKK